MARGMGRRAEFEYQSYLIVMLLVMGALVTFASAAYSVSQKYLSVGGADLSSATSDFSATYNKLDVITEATSSGDSAMQGADLGDESSSSQFYGDVLSFLKITINSIGLPKAIIQDFGTALHAPSIWITIGISIMVILLLTTLAFMIFGNKGTR